MNKSELIAFASAYSSFLLERVSNIKEIILFGSVARGDFDAKSDIDLFVNTDAKLDSEIKRVTEQFYKSKIYELWKNKGIAQKLSVKMGVLKKWELYRSIVSDGILLYGKYRGEIPQEHYLFIALSPIKKVSKRNKVMRKLFGRKEESYTISGLIEQKKRMSPTTFFVSWQSSLEVLNVLRKERVDFKMYECWSDSFR